MTEETIILILRIFALTIVAFILWLVWKILSPYLNKKTAKVVNFEENIGRYIVPLVIKPRVAAVFDAKLVENVLRKHGFMQTETGFKLFKAFDNDLVFCIVFRNLYKQRPLLIEDLVSGNRLSEVGFILPLPIAGNVLTALDDFDLFWKLIINISEDLQGRVYTCIGNKQSVLSDNSKEFYIKKISNFMDLMCERKNEMYKTRFKR